MQLSQAILDFLWVEVAEEYSQELPTGESHFGRELLHCHSDFSRTWPADATPIAAAEAQEFFYALQVYGV